MCADRREHADPHEYSADARLRSSIDAEWSWRIEELGGGTAPDNRRPDPFLPHVDEASQERRRDRWRRVVETERSIDVASLDAASRIERDVHTWSLETAIAAIEDRRFERPADADSGFWTDHLETAGRPLATREDAEAYRSQLAQVPRWFREHIANMRGGLARGFGPPRIAMRGRDAPVRAVAASRPEDTSYAKPFRDALEAGVIAPESYAAALRVIECEVVPAYRELADFLADEYLPSLPESIAAVDAPGGDAYYDHQVREYATVDRTPRELFELGLDELATLREAMARIAERTGFGGDVDALIAFLRADDRFYATSPSQLLSEAAWQAKRFDAVADRWFGLLPRGRFGIAEPSPELAPYYTFGRGGLGIYIVNTYNLRARPLYSLPALTLHEAAPGHAFQMALAAENPELLPYRRGLYISAFGEGWALYCERLGDEMGMYRDDFELMGMLSFQAWRAARLVVDPGIHRFGWSRERAIGFLLENTAIAAHEARTEVDRYIAWPGQATAYTVGELEILAARERARAALGPRFDIRWFHDTVLALGSVPMPVLAHAIDEATAARQRNGAR